jgi:outer membrane protein OmpA-like peptidoglycan-associated protein
MIRLLLVLFITFNLSLAKDFLITINKPFNAVFYDVTQDYDRYITAVGFSNKFTKIQHKQNQFDSAFDYLDSIASSYGKVSNIIKIDLNGNIIFDKFAKIKDFNEAKAVVKTPQNGYFIGGYTLNGSLYIAKLDSNANTLFSKKFGTKNYDRLSNLISLSDGGVLAIGSSTTSRDIYDPLFRTGLGLNDIFITRFNQDGKMLWSKKYGTKYDDRGIDAVEAYDGSILVLSETSYNKNKDITLMRIGQNGDVIWLKHYKTNQYIVPKKITKLKDDNFLVSLIQRDDLGNEQIRLIKFDLQKNVLIDKVVSTFYPSGLTDIKEYSNSTIIGVGFVKDKFNTDALVMIFDSELDTLCQEHYGTKNFDMFNSVKILNNSNAIAAGETTPNNSEETNMYLAMIKPDCKLATIPKKSKIKNNFSPFETKTSYTTNNDYIFQTQTNYQINKKNNYKNNPTPTNVNLYKILTSIYHNEIKNKYIKIDKNLNITFISPRLYFKVGKYKLTSSQKIFLKKFSKKLIPFLKKYKQYIKTLEIEGHTSSEWSHTNYTQKYLKNSSLSLKRAFSVSSYIFKSQDLKTQKFLSSLLKDSGVSFRNTIKNNNKENKKKSRRVVFKIITKI